MVKPVELRAPAYGLEPWGAFGDKNAVCAPALDLVHLSRQTFGDHTLERELLTLFDRQAEHFSARLGAPCASGDAVWRAELVHTLKGSARAVGAFAVGDAAEAYEAALRGDDPGASRLKDSLAAAIDSARASIAGLFETA